MLQDGQCSYSSEDVTYFFEETNTVDRCGQDLVSSWYCLSTAGISNGLSFECGPGLAMMAMFA